MNTEPEIIYEFECICGHIWLDNINQGCPMCGKYEDVIRRDYTSPDPESFGKRKQ